MRFQLNLKLLLLLNGVALVLAAVGIWSLYQVDAIVNGSLYDYGLQFDYEWALPYWTFERLSLGFLGSVVTLSAFSIVYTVSCREFWGGQRPTPAKPRPVDARLPTRRVKEEVQEVEEAVKRQPSAPETSEDGVEVMALPIVCNKCGKVFTQPLCMFDFKSGKPRLVNVCPYCNTVLAVAGNARSK